MSAPPLDEALPAGAAPPSWTADLTRIALILGPFLVLVLLGLGRWLAVNGEAIYDTRPWERSGAVTGSGVDELRDEIFGQKRRMARIRGIFGKAILGIGQHGLLWLVHTPAKGVKPDEKEFTKWGWAIFYIEVR